MSAVDFPRNYRVFCPRCRDEFNVRELAEMVRRIIDRPCRKCTQLGVDAVLTDRTVGV